ncbi:MAG TPA: FliA/WhiG family RNA polymerase sigma factor [Candidatus Glassbacteria bacterium]|nr:FliA/WhiG family RNA polymerase sigma factor [Candidatus Glassbacteria bacterium]
MKTKSILDVWNIYLKNRDDKSKNKLVEHYFTFVNKIASTLSRKLNNHVSQPELASHGVDGLYKAIENFDETRGNKFETYAYIRIKGAMLDGLRKEDWVPRSVRIRETMIQKEQDKIQNDNGKKMTKTEALQKLGIKEVDYHKNPEKFRARSTFSIESCSNSDIDNDDNKKDFNEYLESHNNISPDSNLIRMEFLNKLIGKRFTKLEKDIVYLYYYEELTMKEIAKNLKISESRVSQIHQNILERLKTRIKINPAYFSDNILDIIGKCNNNNPLF